MFSGSADVWGLSIWWYDDRGTAAVADLGFVKRGKPGHTRKGRPTCEYPLCCTVNRHGSRGWALGRSVTIQNALFNSIQEVFLYHILTILLILFLFWSQRHAIQVHSVSRDLMDHPVYV